MAILEGMRVAVLVTDGFEEVELESPVKTLRDEGAFVEILTPSGKPAQAFRHHDKSKIMKADGALEQADASRYDAVMLPGGALNADQLRMNSHARDFLERMDESGRPVAAICHAPWLLVSTRLVKGRTLTSYRTLQDDIRNAGGQWEDRDVVRDGNWVTSRQPSDLPAFNHEMLVLFGETWDHKLSSRSQAEPPANNKIAGGSHPGLNPQ